MAARNVKSEPFEGMDKLSSATLKRNPKNMDLNKNDLLRLLGYLEGELQARDITIAALKAEKAKQLFNQAKYGRFGLSDPFLALQRDSDTQRDTTFDEAAVKAMYDNQLTQLENLIATQRRAQQRMREQLAAVEKRYHKVLAELEEEKRKHAADTEQGDNVTYMLEKDRERLKQEVEFEKAQVKKLEKEIKRLSGSGTSPASSPKDGAEDSPGDDNISPHRHKQMVILLIKERNKLIDKLLQFQQRNSQLENTLKAEQSKTKNMAEGLSTESQRSLQMEAEMEKHLADCDTQRTQLAGRLSKEEAKNHQLQQEVDRLKQQLEQFTSLSSSVAMAGHSPVEIKSTQRQGGLDSRSVPQAPVTAMVKGFKNTPPHTPPEARRVVVRESPERDAAVAGPPPHGKPVHPPPLLQGKNVIYAPATAVVGTIVGKSPAPAAVADRTVNIAGERPVPAEKPADLGARMAAMSAGTASSQQGPTMFTTPSGTRITVAVGGGAAGARKPGVVGGARGTVPPPVPPNKPQFAESADPPSTSSTSSSSSSTSKLQQEQEVTELLGPELADLQQLLVSMVTGTSESDTSSVEDLSASDLPSTPAKIPRAPLCPLSLPLAPADSHSYPLHTYAAAGDMEKLREFLGKHRQADVNQPMKHDGSTPVHAAAEHGQQACLSYLLENGGNTNALREDHYSPLHAAAGEGHHSCLRLLLEHGGFVNQADQQGWTPLHWASYNGHTDCCSLLLKHGARLDAVTSSCWTPLHGAVHMGHVDCLGALLSTTNPPPPPGLLNMADSEGYTVGHLAAARTDKECLATLTQHGEMDLNKKDKQNRNVNDVASEQCREYLQGLDSQNEQQCSVAIALPDGSSVNITRVPLSKTDDWSELEERLASAFLHHVATVSAGLRTKRTIKAMDGAAAAAGGGDSSSPDSPTTPSAAAYSLGLSLNSIKHYAIGDHAWSPGTQSPTTPFEVLTENDVTTIDINLFDLEDGCQDALAYEILIPVPTLQNYLRLVEQYKNLIFYGPSGTGKSLLARKLAQCVQAREAQHGNVAEIHVISLSHNITRTQFVHMLLEKGCLLPASSPVPAAQSPVIVLDDLGKVDIADVLSDILPVIENRGSNHVIKVHMDDDSTATTPLYLHPRCSLLGTMDRGRFTGLPLPVQQQFRWLHFRTDQEPLRTLLQRHLYRRLAHRYRGGVPSHDDMMFRCVEWVICVWLRLNEGLTKLGLHDIIFGPAHFLSCPVDANKPKGILRWLSLLWNHKIAPSVSAAVIQGSTGGGGQQRSTTSGTGQQKVANTALYVLMQRAVVSCCPLSGQEKERYLSSFHGSNELDIKMKTPEKKPAAPANRSKPPSKKLQKGGYPWSAGKDATKDVSSVMSNGEAAVSGVSPAATSGVTNSPKVPVAVTPEDGQPAKPTATPVPAVRHSVNKHPSPQVTPRPAPPNMNLGKIGGTNNLHLNSSPTPPPPPSPYPSAVGASGPVESPATSPGGSVLSPNAHMLFGSSIFAVSGIPSSSSPAADPATSGGGGGLNSSGPGRGASPAPARVTKGSTPPRTPPAVPQRTSSVSSSSSSSSSPLSSSSPHLASSNSLSQRHQLASVKRPNSLPPNSDPRRALSPGPELYRKAPAHEVLARRAFSPGPDILMQGGGERRSGPGPGSRHSLPGDGGSSSGNVQTRPVIMGRTSIKPKQ